MPLRCAAARPCAAWTAQPEQLSLGGQAAREHLPQGLALEQFRHDERCAALRRRRRAPSGCSGDSARRRPGPPARSDASRSASAAMSSGRTLMATVAIEAGVAGPVDLAHAAGADSGLDLVGSQARADDEAHRNLQAAGGKSKRSARFYTLNSLVLTVIESRRVATAHPAWHSDAEEVPAPEFSPRRHTGRRRRLWKSPRARAAMSRLWPSWCVHSGPWRARVR